MGIREYYARSDPEGKKLGDKASGWQTLVDHLIGVSKIAQILAKQAKTNDSNWEENARWAGLLHDLGKYSDQFQRRLLGAPIKVEHSGQGAAYALNAYKNAEIAFAVAGHHSGLAALNGNSSSLKERCIRSASESLVFWERMKQDFLTHQQINLLNNQPTCTPREMAGTVLDQRVRFLASILVDSDRLDAAKSNPTPISLADAQERLQRLLQFIAQKAASTAPGTVRDCRQEVLENCLAAAAFPQNIFSLTVPTGGGKTLASMAFALRRIALFPEAFRRIIVVIPFLSIIEQNAAIYAQAIGNDIILEHHSGELTCKKAMSEDQEDFIGVQNQLAAENWNAPLIVTTSVRFFESLFSNHPSDLRRVHNIARSIVILDEVQVLPREHIKSILSFMQGLANNWGTNFVFCTATQPAFEKAHPSLDDPRWDPGTITEIIAKPQKLFDSMQRVRIQWPGNNGEPARIGWEELAERLAREKRVLCIVNLKHHATILYNYLITQERVNAENTWHLSTRMCPQHRLDILSSIRRQLASDEDAPCRVIATQLVEAGVDIDFPTVFRAMAPFDSIAQAAGRCDREGKATSQKGIPAGKVVVFEPEIEEGKRSVPPGAYSDATMVTRSMVQSSNSLSIYNPEHIRAFFHRWYQTELDPNDIEALRKKFDFPEVARRFRMIEDNTRAVITPYNIDAKKHLERAGEEQFIDLQLRRQFQKYSISLYEHEFIKAKEIGAITELIANSDIWVCDARFYSQSVGFTMEAKEPLIL